jgi:hypothetical protein
MWSERHVYLTSSLILLLLILKHINNSGYVQYVFVVMMCNCGYVASRETSVLRLGTGSCEAVGTPLSL